MEGCSWEVPKKEPEERMVRRAAYLETHSKKTITFRDGYLLHRDVRRTGGKTGSSVKTPGSECRGPLNRRERWGYVNLWSINLQTSTSRSKKKKKKFISGSQNWESEGGGGELAQCWASLQFVHKRWKGETETLWSNLATGCGNCSELMRTSSLALGARCAEKRQKKEGHGQGEVGRYLRGDLSKSAKG